MTTTSASWSFVNERTVERVCLDLQGRDDPAVSQAARSDQIPGVTIHADPQRVAPFYARAHVTVLPIRAGGGTRLKILEAFAHQVSVVSTAIGAEGIAVEPGRHLLVVDDHDALAAACARVLGDPALAARLRAEALELVAKQHHATLVGEDIRRLFRAIVTARRAPCR